MPETESKLKPDKIHKNPEKPSHSKEVKTQEIQRKLTKTKQNQ